MVLTCMDRLLFQLDMIPSARTGFKCRFAVGLRVAHVQNFWAGFCSPSFNPTGHFLETLCADERSILLLIRRVVQIL